MVRTCIAVLCLTVLLAGCDDATVRFVGRRVLVTQEYFAQNYAAGALAIEIHGVPWEGATDGEIAGTLRMPQGPAHDVRFRPISPGDPVVGENERLVLLFNPAGDTGQANACKANQQRPTQPPTGSEFVVVATLCRSEDWIVHGVMEADVETNDWLGYFLTMETLLGRMFPAK